MFEKYKLAFIAASYLVAVIIGGFGYWFFFDKPPPASVFVPGEWQISERTKGGVGTPLKNYDRTIDELEAALEITEGRLVAALTAQLYAPAVEETIIADEVDGRLEWGWERPFGGGFAIADFPTRQVDMTFNEYYIDFAVEIGKLPEPDGRLFATVAVDDEYLLLNETKFYADDPCPPEKWYNKFDLGLGAGWDTADYYDKQDGEFKDGGLTIVGIAGWGGWDLQYQYNRAGDTYLITKRITFF